MDWLVRQSLCSFAPASIPLLQPQGGVTTSRTHSTLRLVSRDKLEGHFWRTTSQERQHLRSNLKRRWSQLFRPLHKEWHVANYSRQSLGVAWDVMNERCAGRRSLTWAGGLWVDHAWLSQSAKMRVTISAYQPPVLESQEDPTWMGPRERNHANPLISLHREF